MKAISPVLPLRRSHVTALSHDLGVSRTKSAWEESLGVMCDMNDCYSRLKELVPSLPQDRSVSKMEILQHVIDYILDLQIALDSSSTVQNTESSVSADGRTVSSQPSNFLREAQTDDHITVSR